MKEIYLDNAATTPVIEEVRKEVNKYMDEEYGNPGSFNSIGHRAKLAVEEARDRIAKILNCSSSELIFTSGGTESINTALKGIAEAKGRGHIITSNIEHHAVLETLKYLEKKGFEVTYLNVDKQGLIDPRDIENAIKKDTILVTIMYANNEIGTIQPIKEIGEICRRHNAVFHTDVCQAAGYLSLDVESLNVDMMSLNGSKIYAPKGTGLLYIKRGTRIIPLIHGGGQEFRLRSGTENVPGIMGLAKALEIADKDKEAETKRLSKLRDKLINGIKGDISKVILNGHPDKRLANNVNISFLDVEGEAVLLKMNEEGICASSGSACTSSTLDPSHVILALNVPYEVAHGSIRFTLGKETIEKDIDKVIRILPNIIKELRRISPVHLRIEDVIQEKKMESKIEAVN